MAAEYQQPDWRVADYAPFCLDERIIDPSTKRPLFIRGPRAAWLEKNAYFVCLGAAQTFGRFCARPFPTLLQEKLSLPVLNISHGGAGPSFFDAKNGRLLQYLNGARFVIVQVMSGRSEGNSLFESDGVGYYRRRSDGTNLDCDQAFSELLRTEPQAYVGQIVEETRRSWCASYDRLLSAIAVPKVLFWFSTRTPDYRQGWRNLADLFGAFPQLVNAAMIDAIRRQCEAYVECTTKRGMPQILVDRFTGEKTTVVDPWTSAPWVENWYYPTPEMHEDAATLLEPGCRAVSAPR
jgi:hypothetical protein